jgi:hypothetical protein
MSRGCADPFDGLMSRTSVVPSGVPSVRHTSTPLETSLPVKKTFPPETVIACGRPVAAVVNCLRNVAFPGVPSLTHSPTCVPLRA